MAYPSYINYIQDHEPVVSSVANRSARALEKRTEALKDRLDAAELGRAITLSDVPVSTDVKVGMPVYWNPANYAFEPAYAQAELDPQTAEYRISAVSHCIGLLTKKTSDTSGDITLHGVVDLPEVAEKACSGGIIYLGSEPGSITDKVLGVSVMLGQLLGPDGPCGSRSLVYINPEYTRQLTHSHFTVDLSSLGWEAVSEDDSRAPEGAVYAYNINNDARVKALFPPIPLYAITAVIDWEPNGDTPGGQILQVNQPNSLIKVNHYGIYWMSETLSPSDGAKISLMFSKVDYSARYGGVTSMQPDTDQPLRFVNCDGIESRYGDLFAQFTLGQIVVPGPLDGTSLRRFTEKWEQETVNTVNGIRTTSSNVRINSVVDIDDAREGTDGYAYKAGLVEIAVDPFLADAEITPQILRLGSALEREYNGVQFVGLPQGRESAVVGKFEIPANYTTGSPDRSLYFKIRLALLGQLVGSFPDLSVELSAIPRPGDDVVNISVLNPVSLDCETGLYIANAGTVFERESNEVVVNPGDTLIIRINRTTTEMDAYRSDAGIVRFNGILNIR